MNRLFLGLLSVVTLASSCQPAYSCNRCGIFGRGCRFSSHAVAVQQVAYQQPSAVQNFVFSNTFPVPYLAQQGNSAFGYSLAAAPYSFDSTAYLDRASRFQELALETAQQGINGFNANAAQATALADAVDRRTKNAVVALAAINANQQHAPLNGANGAVAGQTQTTTFRATVRNGQLYVDNGQPPPPNAPFDPNAPPPAPNPDGFGGIGICAKCHDGQGVHGEPRDIVLDGSRAIDVQRYQEACDDIRSGKMPKNPPRQLTAQERLDVMGELSKLIQK